MHKNLNLYKVIEELILNFEFSKAEKQLSESLEQDEAERNFELANMSISIIAVIKAIITHSEVNYNLAMKNLEENRIYARKMFLSLTFQLYPKADMFTVKMLQLMNDPRFNSQEDDEFVDLYSKRIMFELYSVECYLLKLFLKCIFAGEQSSVFSSLFDDSELIEFRASFMILYHAHKRFETLYPQNSSKECNLEYHDGLTLAWGLCNLLILHLPSQLSTILGISEFQTSSVSDALTLIKLSTSGKGIHKILSILILIIYHSDINNDPEEARRHLDALNEPKSGMVQYFSAKLLRTNGQLSNAIDAFTKIRLIPPIIQIPVYWQMIKCFAESQKWPEAVQYTRSLRECWDKGTFPSKIFSLYLEAAFMQASTGRTLGTLSNEVQGLLVKILETSRTKHKAPRPIFDLFAINRARNVLDHNEHFFLPHFEVLLLWDQIKDIEHKDFVTSQVRKALESSGELTFEQQSLGWLILAVLTDSSIASSKLIINHILPREKALSSNSFICIRAKCELAHCYFLEGDFDFCRKLLTEIEMACFNKNGFLGQTMILLFLSKMKRKFK